MKKLVLFTAMLLLSTLLSAAILMPYDSIFVSRAGRYIDIFANPAAVSFRNSNEGNFLISLNYADNQDTALYREGEKLSFFNETDSSLTLSFGGRHTVFTAGIGFALEGRNFSEGILTYDMLLKLHFQLDLAYSFGPFSIGGRLQGGNSLIRANREVTSSIDILANMLFAEFDNNFGSEYFTLSLGMLWYNEDYYTIGIYSDEVITTENGDVSFSAESLLDSLSFGFSLYLPRFTSTGDLRLIRPTLMFQAGDITSSDSYLAVAGELTFQLLPNSNFTIATGYISYRDAKVNYYTVTRSTHFISIGFDYASFSFNANAYIPTEYYRGDTSTPFRIAVNFRYIP